MEERAGAARHQNGGRARLLVQPARPLQKRRDGLLLAADDLLHELVAHHEVRSGSIFVDEEQAAARLHALYHACRLRGAAARILRGERRGVLAVGQVVDEERYVHVADAAAVLGAQLHRRVVGQHELAPVARDVVVHAALQRFEQGGLPVVAAAHDERDAARHRHARDAARVRQVEGALQLGGRGEGDGPRQRLVGHAASPRQDGPVRNERHQPLLAQPRPQRLLVFGQVHGGLHLPCVQAVVEQGALHAHGQEVEQDALQLARVDGAPERGEPHMEAHGDDALRTPRIARVALRAAHVAYAPRAAFGDLIAHAMRATLGG